MQLSSTYLNLVLLLTSPNHAIPIELRDNTPVLACDFNTVNATCEIDFTIGDSGTVYTYVGKCQQQILFRSGTSSNTFYVCSGGSGPLPLMGGGGSDGGSGVLQLAACDYDTVGAGCILVAASASSAEETGICEKEVISSVGGGASGTLNIAYKCMTKNAGS